jgi:8-oxo-dGTP pyrophosphatase MutT (NUDIX family)
VSTLAIPRAAVSLVYFGLLPDVHQKLPFGEEQRLLAVWNRRAEGWSLPGGKVEEKESIETAQARELEEETSLLTSRAWHVYQAPTADHVEEGRGRHVHLFLVDAVGEPRMTDEACPVRWMRPSEFLNLSPFAKFYWKAFRVLSLLGADQQSSLP